MAGKKARSPAKTFPQSVSSTPERPEVVPPSLGKVSPAPLGVPSQDPREQAQIAIPADESRREVHSALAGGGVVAGVMVGGAMGTAVAGPVGTIVGATVGAAIGATVAVAAGMPASEDDSEESARASEPSR